MVVREQLQVISSNGVNELFVMVWYKKEEEYKGIVQISHGMVEHILRYEEVACYLAQNGYVVVGHDHLGHGRSVVCDEELGYFPGEQPSKILVEDLHQITLEMKNRFPKLPFYLLGHSMGSLLVRRYIMTYSNEPDGVLLLGTGRINRFVLQFGKWFVKFLAWIKGDMYHSPVVENILFGEYNNRFSEDRFGKEWLTKDEKLKAAYVADKKCQFTFSLNGVQMLIDTVTFIQKKENMKKIPLALPIIFMAGTEDPFGEYGRGVNRIYESYQRLGLLDLKIQMYDNDRHEILNETDREDVYVNIVKWLDCHSRK